MNHIPAPSNEDEFSFEIAVSDVLTLRVPNTKEPLWHGKYHDGVLSIYRAEMIGEVVEDTVSFISVYAEASNEHDFVLYNWYNAGDNIESILRDITDSCFDTYCKAKAAIAIQVASDSSKGQTLH